MRTTTRYKISFLSVLAVLIAVLSPLSAQPYPYPYPPQPPQAYPYNPYQVRYPNYPYPQPQPSRQLTYQQEELQKYLAALPRVGAEFNPRNPNSRVGRIYRQLVQATGKQFAVYPAQTGNIGQAHAGGLILIDVSKLSEPSPILAFWLAHEWAHLELGHQPSVYFPGGRPQFQHLPTQREDQADIWAAQFLARAGYPVEQVVSHLRNLPHSPHSNTHSHGVTRARNVLAAYRQAGGGY